MPRLTIEVDSEAFFRAARRLETATTDWRRFLEKGIGPIVLRMVDQAFRRQGRPDAPWPPLKPRTKYRRRKSGIGAQILRDTGRLMQSVVARPPRVTTSTWEIGSNLPYARIHQFGGVIKQGARSNVNPTRWANVGGRLLFQGKDGKVRVASKLDGTPIRRKFATVKEKRLSFRERHIVIPARPYLPDPMNQEERGFLARVLIHYLQQGLQRENP